VVTLALAWRGTLAWQQVPGTIAAQLSGAALGTWLAHAMFELDVLQVSTHLRSGTGQWLAEGVATFGLVLVVLRAPPPRAAAMVAAWIAAGYWFTASTSFANPAAAFGRMLSDTFAGIAPSCVPAFVLAELAGAALALLASHLLGHPGGPATAQEPTNA
jgi:glycerol uptake facilitator-like aquaporin